MTTPEPADAVRAALQKIADSHIPDQPASSPCDELAWAQRHVGTLRRLALQALAALDERGGGEAVTEGREAEPKSAPGDVRTALISAWTESGIREQPRTTRWDAFQAGYYAALEAEPACTDCGDTGVTHQTERRCACQPAASVSREEIAREIDLEACVTLQDREDVSRWMYPARREAALTKADAILALLPTPSAVVREIECNAADADADAELFGFGFLVDGKRVDPSRVTVVRRSTPGRTPAARVVDYCEGRARWIANEDLIAVAMQLHDLATSADALVNALAPIDYDDEVLEPGSNAQVAAYWARPEVKAVREAVAQAKGEA